MSARSTPSISTATGWTTSWSAHLSYENATWRAAGIDVSYAHKDGTWTRRGLASIERRLEITAIAHGHLAVPAPPTWWR